MLARYLGPVLLTSLALVAAPHAVRAQSFSFGISSGGHGHHGHHGHHHHHHHPAFGFSYYRPAPVVYYAPPPPVTYVYPAAPPVTVVQPVQTAAVPAPVTPLRSASAPINAVPLGSNAEVTIRNPAESGGPVAFVAGETMDEELEAGTARTFRDRANLAVEFDRGGNFGTARKVLRAGTYDFVVTEQGWDLVASGSYQKTAAKPSNLQRNSLPVKR